MSDLSREIAKSLTGFQVGDRVIVARPDYASLISGIRPGKTGTITRLYLSFDGVPVAVMGGGGYCCFFLSELEPEE